MSRFEMPLAERELTRSGRRYVTYLLRCGIAVVLLLAVILQMDASNTELDRVGRVLSDICLYFQWGVVLIAAPAVTVGLIAQEKYERTLALLLSADFRGFDVFISKWLSSILQIMLLILTPLPVLGFVAFFGGVEVEVLAMRVVLSLVAAAAVCTISLLASAQASRPADALFIALIYMALWLGPTYYYDVGISTIPPTPHPSTNILYAMIDPFQFGWVLATAIPLILIPPAMLVGVWLIPKAALEEPVALRRTSDLRIERWLSIGPVARLVAAGSPGLAGTARIPFARVIAAVLLGGLAAIPCAGDLLFGLVFFYSVITAINHMASTGALEDLLTTPAKRSEIGQAIMRGNAAAAWVFFPGVCMVGLPKYVVYYGSQEGIGPFGFGWELLPSLIMLILYLIVIAGQFYAWVTFASAVGVQPGRPALQSLFALGILSFLYLVVMAMYLVATLAFTTNGSDWAGPVTHIAMLCALTALNVFVYFVSRSVVMDWVAQAAFLSRAQGYAG